MEIENVNNKLYNDICLLIDEDITFVAYTANKTITLLYWKIEEHINNDLFDNQRADYGKQIVSEVAT